MDAKTTYGGKTICIKGKAIENIVKGASDAFILSRYAMVCWGEDVSLIGLTCFYENAKSLHQGTWVSVVSAGNCWL